jgi:outer membrane protein OmpA-like peptidoglycan-associated protein
MMRVTAFVVLGTFGVLAAGCAPMRRDPNCRWAVPVIGAALGGAGGGLGVSEIESTPDDGERAAGAAAGLVVGSLLGLLVGHFLCEEAPLAEAAPPPPPAAPAPGTKIADIPGPNFEFNQARLTSEGRAKVDEAVRVLRDHQGLRVSVEGHTDSVGTDTYNQRLSERRAQAVADHMIDRGIAAGRLEVRGFGETRPVADNTTAAGRARNRRVEIIAR